MHLFSPATTLRFIRLSTVSKLHNDLVQRDTVFRGRLFKNDRYGYDIVSTREKKTKKKRKRKKKKKDSRCSKRVTLSFRDKKL